MNWTFRSIPLPGMDVKAFINEYAYLAERGIEEWLENFKPEVEKQSEGFTYAEWPEGFCRDEKVEPFAYRYILSVGFYKNGVYYRIGPVPYNITIERATSADYAHEHGVEFLANRIRYIDNAPPIA